jgi:hypothetical protein
MTGTVLRYCISRPVLAVVLGAVFACGDGQQLAGVDAMSSDASVCSDDVLPNDCARCGQPDAGFFGPCPDYVPECGACPLPAKCQGICGAGRCLTCRDFLDGPRWYEDVVHCCNHDAGVTDAS